MLSDLCCLVVGSVNQPADMTRPLSLITHFSLFGCQHGLGQGGYWGKHVVVACCFAVFYPVRLPKPSVNICWLDFLIII